MSFIPVNLPAVYDSDISDKDNNRNNNCLFLYKRQTWKFKIWMKEKREKLGAAELSNVRV